MSQPDKLQQGFSVRGDCAYCPLPLSLDSYGNCTADCHHCYFRRLNRTWGQGLRPLDTEKARKTIRDAPGIRNPGTPLSAALAARKTIRWGNKSDPFQEPEAEHRVAAEIFPALTEARWTFVIQTRFTHNLQHYESRIMAAHKLGLVTLMPVISPGLDRDWERLERRRTTPIDDRWKFIQRMLALGVPLGVNGEPFIPGYHTVHDFRNTLMWLKAVGVQSYNVYNFHFNDYVAKRLVDIGVDIERIWHANQDAQWRPVLRQLLELGKQIGIRLGCPDFVNSGPGYKETANTCCGINVQNPCTFNTHYWKKKIQEGGEAEAVLKETWDGVGDQETGRKIVRGEKCDFYTLRDAGVPAPDVLTPYGKRAVNRTTRGLL